ncbi:MAG: polysaccharide deacetylase family protein, partial [Oscillospiraceae bacterium]
MKKIVATLIAASMIVPLTGCNMFKKPGDPTVDGSSKETQSNMTSSELSSNMSSNISSDTLSDIISDISSNGEVSSENIEETQTPVYLNYEEHDFSYLDNLDNECKGWGQGLQLDEYNRPISGDIYNEKFGEYGGVFIMPNNEGEKKMYLTFDEGYENGYTTPILDALLERNIKAVFFVTGHYAKKNPELIQRMIDEGHIIGNHGMGHKIVPNLTNEEAFKEISDLHNYMAETYNYNMTLFRPPEGKW